MGQGHGAQRLSQAGRGWKLRFLEWLRQGGTLGQGVLAFQWDGEVKAGSLGWLEDPATRDAVGLGDSPAHRQTTRESDVVAEVGGRADAVEENPFLFFPRDSGPVSQIDT